MRNATEKLFVKKKKKNAFAIFLSGAFPPAKTQHKKKTEFLLSAYTLGCRKKRLVAYVLQFFEKRARQKTLKDHVNFLFLGG